MERTTSPVGGNLPARTAGWKPAATSQWAVSPTTETTADYDARIDFHGYFSSSNAVAFSLNLPEIVLPIFLDAWSNSSVPRKRSLSHTPLL